MITATEATRIADEHDATLQRYIDWIDREVVSCASSGVRNLVCTHPDLCELTQVPSSLQMDVRRVLQRVGYRVELEYIDAPPGRGNPHNPPTKMLHLHVYWN